MPNAARTAAACRIARLDRQRFNDLMASGDYDCAPRTSPGVPRVFEMPDLIGLYVFTRLTERGKTVRQASTIACQLVSMLHNRLNAGEEMPETIAIAYGMLGSSFVSPGKDVNPFASHFGGGGAAHTILYSEIWNVANVKAEVENGLKEESRIVGGDE